jgi:hypothetical protein
MATDSNLSHCLSYAVNSQFKWKGDIDQLKDFVKITLLLTGGWSSPEVNPPKFTGQNVFMTFYKSTATLQIQGKDPDKTNLIKRLREIATSEKGNTRFVLNYSTAINNAAYTGPKRIGKVL